MRGDDAHVVAAPEVPYITSEEFNQFIASADGPTLVEFCVPVGCFRCDEMNPAINKLAEENSGRMTARRVNLNTDRLLAAKWGVTVCPSYVVFFDGKEIGRHEYPTSSDLIAASLPAPTETAPGEKQSF